MSRGLVLPLPSVPQSLQQVVTKCAYPKPSSCRFLQVPEPPPRECAVSPASCCWPPRLLLSSTPGNG